MRTTKDGCSIMKRYYCQLHSLQNRFPQLAERGIFTFTWKDLYQNHVNEITDLRYELAAVLFNIAASHTQVGASVTRGDVDGMKVACTHFNCAAWAFGELRERYANVNSGSDFMTTELLVFMQQVCHAQAQECILEKSLIDNRKPNIVAKVTAQIVVYYGAALAALLTGGEDGPVSQVIDSSVSKLWKKYVKFKISYLNCILYLYQGQHAEEQRKMGERVTLYQAAWDKLEEARKESKGLPDQKEINESLIFTADVVEAKRKNAKNENEFIYHEAVPELSTISAVQGANLVNGISFSITDREVAGDDIFARLVPMKAHEASSMYSEEKAKLLRKYGSLIEERDAELTSYMSSLTLDNLNINEEKANKLPQGIVDRCAALNANKTAIPDLIAAMSQLAEITADVEMNLKELAAMLATEEQEERSFQTATGVQRTPNPHITELTREYQKYNEAHTRAGESNNTLRNAMSLHVNNLKILARPLQEIQQVMPKLSSELNTAEIFKDVKLILNKVNEMKAQRAQFHADLRIAVSEDDITGKVIAHGSDEGLQSLFDRELAKHERLTQLIEQNLLAQKNILQALTESYAKAAPVLKTLTDVKQKRENFFSSLAASYDVYEDLLAKSAKGLEFYKKLSGNVQKLLTRFKSARDVQSEERQQRLRSVSQGNANVPKQPAANVSKSPVPTMNAASSSTTPKLRDYLKAKNTSASSIAAAGLGDVNAPVATYIPPVRPVPVGSENPSQAVCSSNTYYGTATNASTAPNEPPPPYSLQQQPFYEQTNAGYTNPMYQQQQQNIAPPAYKLQASPNSQFTNLNTNMANLSLQANYAAQQVAMHQQQQPPLHQQQHMTMNPYGNYNYGSGNPSTPSHYDASQTAYMSPQAAPPQFSAAAAVPAPTSATSSLSANPYSQYYNTNNNVNPNVNYQQTPANAAANTAPPQMYNNPHANYMQQTVNSTLPMTNYSSASGTVAMPIPTTQPLYITTTNPSDTAQGQLHYSLQAPYVVNTGQQQQQQLQTQQPQQQQLPLQQPVQPAAVQQTGTAKDAAGVSQYVSSTNHPGYSYNNQTGNYEYGSGYQQAAAAPTQPYGQYSTVNSMEQATFVGTTDSETANKINVATGFDSPIVSHTKTATQQNTPIANAESSLNYYTPPYGYQSVNQSNNIMPQNSSPYAGVGEPPTNVPVPVQPNNTNNNEQPQQYNQRHQNSTYMQSGGTSIANTQTTQSNTDYASTAQHTPAVQGSSTTPAAAASTASAASAVPTANASQQQTSQTAKTIAPKKSSNLDLLSDIDFSGVGISGPPPILPGPVLQPQVVSTPPSSQVAAPATKIGDVNVEQSSTTQQPVAEPLNESTLPLSPTTSPPPPTPTPAAPLQLASPVDSYAAARKTSFDNLSNCSDLSSLENFDWDSVSMRSDKLPHSTANDKHSATCYFQMQPIEPFNDENILKYFHKEVERFEKTVESLNVKMLNGHTQLTAKWKELQDVLSKELNKRSTTVAKLFPEKNRSLDCLPYDHARVKLDKNTDDYINAAYIKNLGNGCPNFIIAQTPQQNTNHDFWSMLWSEKARSVICLHTTNEILDPFWPQEMHKEMQFDDFAVKCVKVNTLSHCVEYNLKLSMHGADPIIDLSLLQLKQWTKGSHSQVLGIARNAIQAHQQRCLEFNAPASPLIMNCLTGSERSELVAVAIAAILATQISRPVLINVIDVWSRICAQRQNSLRDTATLEQSMQVVLANAHDVLNKRGIITSYQMKIAPQVASKEKEEIKDPLNELDPLWKLK